MVFAAVAILAVPPGVAAGVFVPGLDVAGWARMAAIALLVPAAAEEAVFRGPLLIARASWRGPLAAGLLAAFVLWHMMAPLWLGPAAAALLRAPAFLFAAAVLGAGATVLVLRTGRLWPAIVLHWAAVMGWKLFLGGPALLAAAP
jgi:predicted Abi (CAAX) family protease